jgi:outer membrane lipoprotein
MYADKLITERTAMFKNLFALIAIVLLSACASRMPAELSSVTASSLRLADVKRDVDEYENERVLWGGTIIVVENDEDETRIQILEKPLSGNAKPKEYSDSEGRFLMRTTEFLDPAIYTQGRKISVAGTIKGEIERQVGNRAVTMPILNAESHYLWPETEPMHYYYPYPYLYYGYPYYRYSRYRFW